MRGLGVSASSHSEAFPGLSGFERIMFKPCKDKRQPPQAMSWTVKHFHMTKSSPEVWPAGRAPVCRSEEARPSPACFSETRLELLVCLLWPQMDWSGMRSPTHPGGWQSHRIKEKLCLFSVQLRTRLWQECQHVYLAAKMLNESIEITFIFKETEYVMVSKSLFERSTKLYFLTNWSKYKI